MRYMFKIINYLAKKISLYLCKTDNSNDNYDYYEYALIGIMSFTMYCFIAICFSLLFGYFPYILFIIPCLLNIRSQSGGSHAKSSFWCCITTTIMYIIIGLSTYLNKYYLILFFISFICFTGLKEIPKYTATATHHKEEKQKFFQLNYIVRLFIVFILNLLSITLYLTNNNLEYIDFSKMSCILSSCVIINRFSLSNLCFKLLDKTGKGIEE